MPTSFLKRPSRLAVALAFLAHGSAQGADYSVAACLARQGQTSEAIASTMPAPRMAAQPSEPRPCSERGTLVWRLALRHSDVGQDLRKVLERKELKVLEQTGVAGNLRAVRLIGGNGPFTGLERLVPAGTVGTTRIMFEQFGAKGVEAACARFLAYLPRGVRWNEWGAKLPLGLWGGHDDGGGGGVPLACQKGFSVRLLNGGRSLDEKLILYSYHLNRRDVAVDRTRVHKSCPLAPYFGAVGEPSPEPLARGRLVPVEIEVVLNRPGYADGLIRLYVDGEAVAESRRLAFRCGSEWAIRGTTFMDMWGGTPTAPEYQSPKRQSLYYGGFKLFRVPAERPAELASAEDARPAKLAAGIARD